MPLLALVSLSYVRRNSCTCGWTSLLSALNLIFETHSIRSSNIHMSLITQFTTVHVLILSATCVFLHMSFYTCNESIMGECHWSHICVCVENDSCLPPKCVYLCTRPLCMRDSLNMSLNDHICPLDVAESKSGLSDSPQTATYWDIMGFVQVHSPLSLPPPPSPRMCA